MKLVFEDNIYRVICISPKVTDLVYKEYEDWLVFWKQEAMRLGVVLKLYYHHGDYLVCIPKQTIVAEESMIKKIIDLVLPESRYSIDFRYSEDCLCVVVRST